MAKNTTPVAFTPEAKPRTTTPADVRLPLTTTMASARQHGHCSPTKGKTTDTGYKT